VPDLPEVPKPGPKWRQNEGYPSGKIPKGTRGKRVQVVMANGQMGKESGVSTAPPGWAADGKGGCRWTLAGSPFDIAWFLVL
jgi:hypothetical protein